MPKKIAFATCTELPQIHEDDARTLGLLAEYGIEVEGAVWDDKAVDWSKVRVCVCMCLYVYVNVCE